MSRFCAGAAGSVERFFQLSVLGLLTAGYLAVVGSGYLDLPTVILTAAGLALRALVVSGLVRLEISDRFVNAATLAYVGFYPLDFLFLSRSFLQATVHLLFFLAVMRVLTTKTNRDYLYVATIAFLELLAAAILSVNLNFFAFLTLYLLFAMAGFTGSEIRRSMQAHQQVARNGLRNFTPRLAALTALITLGILSLTAGLFFLLPRTADAAFRHLISQRYHLPGFSNQVTLGEIGEIKTSSRAVMHVRVLKGHVPENSKWRGGALSDFDGRKWFNGSSAGEQITVKDGRAPVANDQQRRRDDGRHILYRVDLNALDSDTLFFAGLPEFLNLPTSSLIRTATGGYRLRYVPLEGFRYEVEAFLDGDPNAAGVAWERLILGERYLQLPSLDPRVSTLARDWASGESSDFGRARAIESHLRRQFGYTLELPSKEVTDPLAHFLFERRKGHCEYFASAMAVMLRAVGIPARLVNGFQSGVWNPISEMYVIRASDAHSWVEAYLPNRGWTTFDPTPPDPGARSASVWTRLAFYVDAAEIFWQEWILSYDLRRQVSLAVRMEQRGRRFATDWQYVARSWITRHAVLLSTGLILFVVLVSIGPRGWRGWQSWRRARRVRRGLASSSDATLLYERMLELLYRKGYQKPSWLTPREFSRSLPPSTARSLVEQFTSAYNALRFGGKLEAASAISALLEQIERQV